MTKELRKKLNLSKQICKICNLQPKKEDDGGGWYYECYPNFLSPENFVKLFELPITDKSYLAEYMNKNFNFSNRETFLKTLILACINKPSIKQAIREAEWKYE